MALQVGTTSYIDRLNATKYIEDRPDSEVWETAGTDTQEDALVTATRFIDDRAWIGTAVSASQLLGWPRTGASYIDPKLGLQITVEDDEIPERLKRAVSELAFYFVQNPGVYQSTQSVPEQISIGPISISDHNSKRKNPRIPPEVNALVKPLTRANSVSRTWWRAN